MSERPIVLVDMDGVVAQFEHRVLHHWQQLHPDKAHVPLEQRRGFEITSNYPEEHREHLWDLFNRPALFSELEPEPGAVEAIKELDEYARVFFCSKPLVTNPTCHSDKNAWIARHFGPTWCKRLILTSDKTLVRGDILIDDKPDVTGVVDATWRHVLYRTHHNVDSHPLTPGVTAHYVLDGWHHWKRYLGDIPWDRTRRHQDHHFIFPTLRPHRL